MHEHSMLHNAWPWYSLDFALHAHNLLVCVEVQFRIGIYRSRLYDHIAIGANICVIYILLHYTFAATHTVQDGDVKEVPIDESDQIGTDGNEITNNRINKSDATTDNGVTKDDTTHNSDHDDSGNVIDDTIGVLVTDPMTEPEPTSTTKVSITTSCTLFDCMLSNSVIPTFAMYIY
jgi:hypothetical protein